MKSLIPTMKVRLIDTLKAQMTFIGMMFALVLIFMVLLPTIAGTADSESSFTSYGMVSMIYMFVVGIVEIREYLRSLAQSGVGRKTTFVSQILIGIENSVVVAIAGEIIMFIGQLITKSNPNMEIADIYYLLFKPDIFAPNMVITMKERLLSIMVVSGLLLFTHACGTFISLLFYRLPKPLSYVVGFGTPVLIPSMYVLLTETFEINWNFVVVAITWITSAPSKFFVTFVCTSVIIYLLAWLLMRRAPVKPANG